MALTQLKTSGIADDAVTTDKLANAINTERTANTAKVSTTINNNADNRVITGSGTANTLEGESSLTYDGGNLTQTVSVDGKGIVLDAGNVKPMITGDSNRIGAGNTILGISGKWNGTEVARVAVEAGADTTNKDDGTLNFSTTTSGGSLTKRMIIDADGRIGVGIVPQASQYSGWTILQVGESGALTSNKTTGDTNTTELSNNSYLNSDASAYKYHHNDEASRYTQSHGRHAFHVAASGSGDADISFSEKLRIDSDGLKFNGDTGAAYALDDYEEGNWTPTSNVGSITVSTAHYVKIGSLVMAQAYVTFPGMSGADAVQLNGYPFTTANSTDFHTAAVNSDANLNTQLCGQFVNTQMLFATETNSKANVNQLSGHFVVVSVVYTTH